MNEKPRQKSVTIFTTPSCYWCRVAKRYCDEHEIEYCEIDVTTDSSGRREMLLMTGQNGVPVIRVGSHAMIGWDEDEFEKLRSGAFRRR